METEDLYNMPQVYDRVSRWHIKTDAILKENRLEYVCGWMYYNYQPCPVNKTKIYNQPIKIS